MKNKKLREEEFKQRQIDKFTDAYSDVLWRLSIINRIEEDDFDLYEILADINKELSNMAEAFEQMYTHALNLEKND